MKNSLAIETGLKNKRLHQKEPIDACSWAFMRELRMHHEGRKIYEIDPYAEVYPIRENLYAILKESLDGMGDVWLYLLVGTDKAMLIDTGFGLGNLKGLCSHLSGGKELIVVNTHPHIDHCYGNCQFDQVYCHEYAVPTLKQLCREDAWDHLFDETGKPIWAVFDRSDLIDFRQYEITGVPDGTVFDLGDGQLVELIFTAGHASGHCMFLDRKNRLLFAGDDIVSMRIGIHGPKQDDPYGEYATLTRFREQLEKLVRRKGEFDSVFPGHFIFDLESQVVVNLLEVVETILNCPEDYDAKETAVTARGTIERMLKFVPGLGTIGYTKNAF